MIIFTVGMSSFVSASNYEDPLVYYKLDTNYDNTGSYGGFGLVPGSTPTFKPGIIDNGSFQDGGSDTLSNTTIGDLTNASTIVIWINSTSTTEAMWGLFKVDNNFMLGSGMTSSKVNVYGNGAPFSN